MQYTNPKRAIAASLALVLTTGLAVACSTRSESTSSSTAPSAQSGPQAVSAAAATLTGVVDTVTVTTDNTGNYFKPNTLTVHRGDVIRFILVTGVHNIDFLPDSNPRKAGLPPASMMLQLPGQTLDIPVNFAPGNYYFQCDPHAALGMRGRLTVAG
jgi:plastocyanin